MVDDEKNGGEFQGRARKKANDFTRRRKLPFGKLCLFLIGIAHECLTVAFRRFDERSLAKKHIDGLVERTGIQLDKELIISDRGCPSEDMIDYHGLKICPKKHKLK